LSAEPIDVLLVEDDPGDILLTQEALQHSTMPNRLHVARDGVEALAFLRREGRYHDAPRPDLVLLDLNLPGKDGRQVLAEIRSSEELTHLPVVVLTTSDNEEDVLGSYRLHANAFVTKPIDFSSFVGAVRQIEAFFVSVIVKLPHVRD
jgi:CheY-like chemotaxis protein